MSLPFKVTEEVVRSISIVGSLPISPLKKIEPGENGCVESLVKRVCRLHLEKYTDERGLEEYYAVLEEKFGFFGYIRLIFGYWDENIGYDVFDPEIKTIEVAMYEGPSIRDLVYPEYGHLAYSFDKFMVYFNDPVSNNFDDSDNQFRRSLDEGLIDIENIPKLLDGVNGKILQGIEAWAESKRSQYEE
tara:strand:- start:109 stop:672 length:564 start_codon:yes stop_codon:yes gene_type:complete